MTNLTDEKLKAYFDELWRQYQQSKRIREKIVDIDGYLYVAGECAGLDFAIETLKSMFELGEYAEGSEK